MKFKSHIKKMKVEAQGPLVQYALQCEIGLLPMNSLIGTRLQIQFLNEIRCVSCLRPTKKSFNQGYCYPCSIKLAECDLCILKPELCHYHKGTCRQPEWGEKNCMIPHTVYLANSSGIKVGITRTVQQTTRWMDQGATQALPIFQVTNRLDSGKVEHALKMFLPDKTNWRKLLQSHGEKLDLEAKRAEIYERAEQINLKAEKVDAKVFEFQYPVENYPEKITTFDFDKNPSIDSTLTGIRGQYLIFKDGVINVRKFSGYVIELVVEKAVKVL